MGNQRRYSLRDVENLKQKKPTFPKPLILPASPIARPEQPVLANEIINPTPSSLPSPKPSNEVVSHESLKTQQRFALSSFAQLPLRLTLVLISLLGGLSVLALMSIVLTSGVVANPGLLAQK